MTVRHFTQRLIKLIAISFSLVLLGLGLSACNQTPKEPTKPVAPPVQPVKPPVTHHELYDYGEKNLTLLAQKLQGRKDSVHIVQLGDSHTAADFFTGELRQLFQRQYGDAGLGFVPPTTIRGQRVATVKFTEPKKQWHLSSSRVDQADHFPLGGFILQPTQENSALTLGQYSPTDHTYQLRALYQSQGHTALQFSDGKLDLSAAKQWQFSTPKTVHLPLTLQADTESGVQLGGWLLEREQPGVMLSALGINGATISMFEKWHSDWQQQLQSLQPDLVVLAYGTNEAFNDTLDVDEYKQALTQTIKVIRQNNPNVALLLVGPNDSIKFKQAETCKTQQPVHLRDVIDAQQQIAQEQQTLFWDWQQYMGGDCSVNRWINQELAQPDKVHLSRAGYERSAKALFDALQHRMNL